MFLHSNTVKTKTFGLIFFAVKKLNVYRFSMKTIMKLNLFLYKFESIFEGFSFSKTMFFGFKFLCLTF